MNRVGTRYPKYRDTGYGWLLPIPAHWEIRRSRFVFRETDQRSADGHETHLSMTQTHGLIPSRDLERRRLHSASYAGGKLVRAGDLVLNRLKAHLGVFAGARQSGTVSPDYSVFRSLVDRPVEYYEKLFKTPMYVGELRRSTRGIVEGFWRLYTDDFYNIPALLPPREEQDRIVAYLRAQDAQIARFIRDKRRLIEVLNEQKQTLIHRAVTRGLDPKTRLKPSGIEWLGEVPAHWELLRLKFIAKQITGGSTPPSGDLACWGGSIVWVTPKDVSRSVRLRGSLRTITDKGLAACSTNLVQAGSLIVTSRAPVGNVSIADVALCTNQGCKAIVPDFDRLDTMFAYFVLQQMKEHLQTLANGTTFSEIGASVLASQFIPVPKIQEQRRIVDVLTRQLKPFDDAIENIQDELEVTKNYRDRLIADVVTGQLDVRGWVPGPDDVIDEIAALLDDEDETMGAQGAEDDDDGHE